MKNLRPRKTGKHKNTSGRGLRGRGGLGLGRGAVDVDGGDDGGAAEGEARRRRVGADVGGKRGVEANLEL